MLKSVKVSPPFLIVILRNNPFIILTKMKLICTYKMFKLICTYKICLYAHIKYVLIKYINVIS